jgi:heptosyltransferase-1
LHPGVNDVLRIAVRRWRRSWWRSATRADIAQSFRRIAASRYDAVIDAQGLMKSALISFAARGKRYGFDWRSSREPLSAVTRRTFGIPWSLHAVARNRLLVARSLDYEVPAGCDYGVAAAATRFEWLPAGPYAVLLHASSGAYKLWPEASWIDLARRLSDSGTRSVLPWGNARERDSAARIAGDVPSAIVAPALSVAQFPGVFAGARAVVGVDTGLTHLAGALGIPTLGIYVGTDAAATGLYGCKHALNVGGERNVPDVARVWAALATLMPC